MKDPLSAEILNPPISLRKRARISVYCILSSKRAPFKLRTLLFTSGENINWWIGSKDLVLSSLSLYSGVIRKAREVEDGEGGGGGTTDFPSPSCFCSSPI